MSSIPSTERPYFIDCLQYCRWSESIFEQMAQGQVDAVHVTIAYWETCRETLERIGAWNRWFERLPDRLMPIYTGDDVRVAHATGRTGILFGFQNCSPIEDDIDLVEIFHRLGVRFMQLSYNNQSPLATGCYEAQDPGITRFGKQVIREMNRVGMVIDMSHSAERSTLHAIELSERPIAITHANPASWSPALRNKSDTVLKALAENGGMLGFSVYPHHLKGRSECTVDDFCEMIETAAELMGIDHIGMGTDMVQDQPVSIVEWMRNGRWSKEMDFGEGSASDPGWPDPVPWFADNRGFPQLVDGLKRRGFSDEDTAKVVGGNWLRFYDESFIPAAP
jgi:membrane dipeptidase